MTFKSRINSRRPLNLSRADAAIIFARGYYIVMEKRFIEIIQIEKRSREVVGLKPEITFRSTRRVNARREHKHEKCMASCACSSRVEIANCHSSSEISRGFYAVPIDIVAPRRALFHLLFREAVHHSRVRVSHTGVGEEDVALPREPHSL